MDIECLKVQNYFIEDKSQNYFIFQPLLKGLLDESIKCPATSDNSVSPKLDYFNNPKFRVNFNGSCSTTDRVFTLKK